MSSRVISRLSGFPLGISVIILLDAYISNRRFHLVPVAPFHWLFPYFLLFIPLVFLNLYPATHFHDDPDNPEIVQNARATMFVVFLFVAACWAFSFVLTVLQLQKNYFDEFTANTDNWTPVACLLATSLAIVSFLGLFVGRLTAVSEKRRNEFGSHNLFE